jgi:glutamate carboxypeptidase
MARKIVQLEELADYAKGTVVNVGIVTGGIAANSIAENAYMRVDIRLGNRTELERVEQALTKIFTPFDAQVQIDAKRTLFYPSFDFTPEVDRFSQLVIASGREIGLDVKQQFRVSGSEANWISHYNPSCAILDGFGVVGKGDHSQQEFFLLGSFLPAVDLTTKVISKILA